MLLVEVASAHWFQNARAEAFRRLSGKNQLLVDVEPERLAATRWAQFNERLAVLPHTDTAGWAAAARETAAALAAWGDPAAARTALCLGAGALAVERLSLCLDRRPLHCGLSAPRPFRARPLGECLWPLGLGTRRLALREGAFS